MGPDAPMSYEFEFEMTQADVLDACHQLLVWDRASDTYPKSRVVAGTNCNRAYTWGLILLAGGLILGGVTLLRGYANREPLSLLLGVALGLMAVVGAYLFGKARLGYRVILNARDPLLSVQALRAHPGSLLMTGKRKARLDGAGFRWAGEQESLFVGWERMLAFVPLESCAAVVMQETMFFPIPRRAFPRAEDVEAFCELGERQLRSHGCDLESRLTKHFSSRDSECPKCRYKLRGCRTTHCPECGRKLTLEDFPEARWEHLASRLRPEQ